MTVSDNCSDSEYPSPASRKGPGNYCPNPDYQVYVSLIYMYIFLLGDWAVTHAVYFVNG